MSNKPPSQVSDGNWSSLIEESRDMSFPFSDKGDFDTFEMTLKYKQAKEAYKKLPSLSTKQFPLGLTYLVQQGSPSDIGNGLWEFSRTFSMLPASRYEGATIAFPLKLIYLAGSASHLITFSIVTSGEYYYEYFLTKPPTIIAPRFYFGVSIAPTGIGTWGAVSGLPATLIPQDSEVGIYKGGIYYRKTPYVSSVGLVLIVDV
tara:strand:+ start:4300 stop:4908 length:609 start_codon:yes stop_codon:yes gene_type:complete